MTSKRKSEDKKAFIFLYPHDNNFEFDIRKGCGLLRLDFVSADSDKEILEALHRKGIARMEEIDDGLKKAGIIRRRYRTYRKKYLTALNRAIDERYRKKGFDIFFALLDSSPISEIIRLDSSDRIIEVGMDAKTHKTKRADGTYPYPDNNYIIDQLGDISILSVGGFHLWDCVEKLAIAAHERGLRTLIDDDLTNYFTLRLADPNFNTDRFPSIDKKDMEEFEFLSFMEHRKGKPWFFQNY